MLEFQRTSLDITRSFIESQQRVMLAYLTRADVPGLASYTQNLSGQMQNYSEPVMGSRDVHDPAVILPAQVQATVAGLSDQYQQQRHSQVLIEAQAISAVHAEISHESTALVKLADAASVVSTPAVVASSSSVAASSDSSSPEQLIESLIAIVADRTGYPPEMLDPTLDLEADLGIDSIKRVEILNSFRKLLPEDRQNALEDGIERLAGVKTLQGIMDWIKTELGPDKALSTNPETSVSQLDSVSAQAG